MIEKFTINITSKAEEDINNTYLYILNKFKDQNAAVRIYDDIKSKIKSLQYMPTRYPVIERSKYNGKDVYKAVVDNYLVLYTIVDNTVNIIRVPYSRRAISQLLK